MPFCTLIGKDPVTKVERDRPVIVVWGWGASTESQVQDHLVPSANITTVTLDGKALEGITDGKIIKDSQSGQYKVVWTSLVGVLEPGAHMLTYDVKWKKTPIVRAYL